MNRKHVHPPQYKKAGQCQPLIHSEIEVDDQPVMLCTSTKGSVNGITSNNKLELKLPLSTQMPANGPSKKKSKY